MEVDHMDYTAIIVAALSTLTSIGVALVGIIPAIKKNSIKSEELSTLIKKEIEAALESSETIKGIQQSNNLLKNGLKAEMRATLLKRYLEFEEREFALTEQEYKEWNGKCQHLPSFFLPGPYFFSLNHITPGEKRKLIFHAHFSSQNAILTPGDELWTQTQRE